VVTGHFHHPLLRSDPAGTVVALGDWIDQYSYAVLENGAFRMESA
jgi:UDP-2,3-diacylglucosamine hydrolase